MGFTWKKIAEILCVSERTLRTKRHELKISEKYTEIEDNRIDDCIQDILEESPNMGEKILLGALKSLVWIPHLLPALIILRRLRVNEKGRESVVEVNQNAALYGLQFLSNQIAYNHCFEFIFILCVYFFSFVLNQNRLFFF